MEIILTLIKIIIPSQQKKQDYKQMRLSYSTDPMPIYEENQL